MPAGAQPKPGAASGAAGGMGDMMKGMMGGAKEKEFYPSLMTLPPLSEETKTELNSQAHDRMKTGAAAMNQAIIDLTTAAEENNFPRMKEASGDLSEALAQFESGVATREALAEGKSPQEIGLSWYKKSLNLRIAGDADNPEKTFFGTSIFHLFIMTTLALFSLAMIAMYFFKMRRATKLLTWLQARPSDIASSEQTSAKAVSNTIWKGKLKVATISEETPTVKTFRLANPCGGDLPFSYLAGQFLTLSVVIDGKTIKRAYTISSHPCDKRWLEITIKREENGLVSRYMNDVVHEYDLLELEAATGKLTFSGVTGEGIVLIGGGVGITPLMSVLRCLISCGMKNEIHLLYACKSLSEFVYHEELRQLQARNSNLRILVAVEKLEGEFPGAYEGRLTKDKIFEAVPKIARLRVHLCGPPGMMKAVHAILDELKVLKEQIKEEAFGSAKPPTKAADSNAATGLKPASEIAGKKVLFTKAAKTVEIHEGETVLELSETSGIEIPFQCRVGTCGLCKVKLVSGEVTMEVEDALTAEDKEAKIILACQAKAQSDLEIEEP